MRPSPSYPEIPAARSRWILRRRSARASLDPWRPYAFLVEDECSPTDQRVPVATVFLTNRECPWRCVYCDLWKNTLTVPVPAGAIPAQMDHALRRLRRARAAQGLPPPRHLKLYNAGSFFDPRAIPPAEWPAIARRAAGFQRVIVECHPALIGPRAVAFRDLLVPDRSRRTRAGEAAGPELEIAMGLETVDPAVLERLNKRMSLGQFTRAADWLRANRIALRVFILVQPPWTAEAEALERACRALDFAFDHGASAAVLIPVRGGNGALEALAARGDFRPPRLATLESALDYGLSLRRGRVFADTWDLGRLADCDSCFTARAARLDEANRRQAILARAVCPLGCESGGVRGART